VDLKASLKPKVRGLSKSFRTGRLEWELQMVQLFATRYSCILILWVSLVSFPAIILFVASQLVFIVVSVYLVIDSVRNLLDTNNSYVHTTTLCSVLLKHVVPWCLKLESNEFMNVRWWYLSPKPLHHPCTKISLITHCAPYDPVS
jgi:hypothetical protein